MNSEITQAQLLAATMMLGGHKPYGAKVVWTRKLPAENGRIGKPGRALSVQGITETNRSWRYFRLNDSMTPYEYQEITETQYASVLKAIGRLRVDKNRLIQTLWMLAQVDVGKINKYYVDGQKSNLILIDRDRNIVPSGVKRDDTGLLSTVAEEARGTETFRPDATQPPPIRLVDFPAQAGRFTALYRTRDDSY